MIIRLFADTETCNVEDLDTFVYNGALKGDIARDFSSLVRIYAKLRQRYHRNCFTKWKISFNFYKFTGQWQKEHYDLAEGMTVIMCTRPWVQAMISQWYLASQTGEKKCKIRRGHCLRAQKQGPCLSLMVSRRSDNIQNSTMPNCHH